MMGLQNKLKKDLLSYLQEDFVCRKVVRCPNNAARGSDKTSERKRARAHVNSTPLVTTTILFAWDIIIFPPKLF